MKRLDGKVAFVTGAARGQGRSHCVRLAEEGADIIAIDSLSPVPGALYEGSTHHDLNTTSNEVEALGRSIFVAQADVRDQAGLDQAVAQGVAAVGPLDIVVANAGILTDPQPAHELSDELWTDMIDVNLSGVWRTTKAAIPAMNDGGSIILIGSIAALKANRNIAHYVAAKHGVIGLMRSLALELAPRQIRVNSVHPTQVNTDMIMHEASYQLFCPHLTDPTVDDFAATSQRMHALPEPWVTVQEVSHAVAFLASDDSRAITGVPLPIDLGYLIA